MSVGIKAVYKNGVFRPLESVKLPEGTEVEVIVKSAGPILRKYAGMLKKSEHEWEAEYYEYIEERAGGS